MDNEMIASHFDEMAELLEIRGESTFRVRAYRNGAKAIRDLTESVASILADPARKLTDLPGIGDAISDKCKVLLETGKIPQLEELRQQVPAGLLQIMRVPGLGAKKAKPSLNRLTSLASMNCEPPVNKRKSANSKASQPKQKSLSLSRLISWQQLRPECCWTKPRIWSNRCANTYSPCHRSNNWSLLEAIVAAKKP